MQVYLGIFARNEAERLPALLNDLARQTLFQASEIASGVAILANGCSDDTAAVARSRFETAPFRDLRLGASVREIAFAGKSNAWNEFVHSAVPAGTDLVFFIDADIRIPNPEALELMARRLISSSKAVVAVDRSVKDLELETPKSITERLIKAGTGTAHDVTTAIAGALYCVRYLEAKKLWLPIGLPGEDGFVRAMLLTSGFEHEERLERHLFVPEAHHVFESLRSAKAVQHHNVRLAIGTAINILLFHHLRSIQRPGTDLADYIRGRNNEDPEWINSLVRERLQESYFPLEPRWLLRRLRQGSRIKSLRRLAIMLMGLIFDLSVFLKATVLMRRGAGAGYW